MISKQKFEDIKEKYGDVASWAVWAKTGNSPKSNIGDVSVFDIDKNSEILKLLNVNVVMVGFNFSRNVNFIEKFKNFHDSNPMGQDYKIRYAFEGTDFYGAYMTDVIKNFVMVDSTDVKKYLKLNVQFLKDSVSSFKNELVDIGSEKPVILAFGNDVYAILKNNLEKECYSKLIKITHYSHHISKENYKEKVLQEISI